VCVCVCVDPRNILSHPPCSTGWCNGLNDMPASPLFSNAPLKPLIWVFVQATIKLDLVTQLTIFLPMLFIGLAIYIRCIHSIFGREITKYMVYIYGSGQP